jgi:hypothetical protein
MIDDRRLPDPEMVSEGYIIAGAQVVFVYEVRDGVRGLAYVTITPGAPVLAMYALGMGKESSRMMVIPAELWEGMGCFWREAMGCFWREAKR